MRSRRLPQTEWQYLGVQAKRRVIRNEFLRRQRGEVLAEKITGRHKLFIALSFCAYLVFSLYYNLYGTEAPVMMNFYNILPAQQGFIMTMQSIGNICTALFIALRGEKYNKIHVIAIGLLIISLSSFTISFAPAYGILIFVVMAAGVGCTFVDVMMNSVISDVYPRQKNTLLPIAHAFYGTGAMIAPFFVTMTVNPDSPQSFVHPFLFVSLFVAAEFVLYFLIGNSIVKETPYVDREAVKKRVNENPAEIFKTKAAWFFMAVGILYFSFQQGIANWLPTFSMEYAGVDFSTAGMMLSAFFAGTLAMRFLGPFLLKKIAPHTFFAVFGGIAALLMLAAVLMSNATVMMALVAVSGFLQGCNVVTYIIICCDAFPQRTASASSLCALTSGIAAMTAPLWMGGMAEYMGFQIPMVIACGCLLASALLVAIYSRRIKRSRPA